MIKNNDYVRDEEFASTEVFLKSLLDEARFQFTAGGPQGVYSVGGREIVQTALKKRIDVALDALREFYVAKAMRDSDGQVDDFEKVRLEWFTSKILQVGDQTLEIDPDDIESIDWSLPVEVIEEADGKRRAGQKGLTLDIKFKEKGPKWTEKK